MDASVPWVYLVIGAAGSQRRAVLADLIANGLAPGETAAVYLAPEERDAALEEPLRAAGATLGEWATAEGALVLPVPDGPSHVFVVTDGRRNPVDQIEAFKEWLEGRRVRLARVLCVVDASLAQRQPALDLWFEACVHFADFVLLTKPEGIDHKWFAAFEKRYAEQYYPCRFEVIRRDGVRNPAEVLVPEARRVAQVFDEDIELADESDEEVAAAKPENDRFFARKRGGSRVVELPDIRPFLGR